MDVRCPQCDTLYEIDARQLRGGAATFKCSQCDHVFRLQTHAALSQENQRRWMAKNTASGDILYFSSFDELHQWIMQGTVGKDDQISRTGKKWKRLGDIGEFMPIFQAVESISSISSSHAVQKDAARERAESTPKPAPESPAPESSAPEPVPADSGPQYRSKVKTSKQFGAPKSPSPAPKRESSGPLEPARSPTPAPTPTPQTSAEQPRHDTGPAKSQTGPKKPKVRLQTGAFGAADEPAVDEDDWSFGDGTTLGEVENTGRHNAVEYESGGSRWPIVALVVLLVVGGGGAAVYFARPDLIEKYLPQQADEETVDIAKEEEGVEDDTEPSAEDKSPQQRLALAVGQAVGAAEEANATHLAEGIAAASPKVAAGVEEAAKEAKEAAEEPDPEELLAKGKRYLESGRPGRARSKFHEVLEVERNNVEAITGLGWSLLALGNPGSASAQFRKALNYNPSFGDAYIGLGKAEREQGNTQAALEAYQDYLSRFPGGSKSSIAQYQAEKLKKALGQ